MNPAQNDYRRSRAWAEALIGFVIGLVSLFLAYLIDLSVGESISLSTLLFHVDYLFAAVAFAVCSPKAIRLILAPRADISLSFVRSLHASAVAFALFLPPTLLSSYDFPARRLFYFFVLGFLFDWLVSVFFLRRGDAANADREERQRRPAAILASSPHAIFAAIALFWLALALLFLLADQSPVADRLANWAFAFLALSVAIALLRMISPIRIREAERSFRVLVIGLTLLSFLVIGYSVTKPGSTEAEASYIVQVHPGYLANHMQPGDMIISDSPDLRLGSLPDVPAHLDLRPDERGLGLWDDLIRALEGRRQVFWVTVPSRSQDTQQILSTFLQSNGCLDDEPATFLPVKLYEMREPLVLPRVLPPPLVGKVDDAFDPAQVDFGSIQIAGFRVEPKVCSHDAAAVAIDWHLGQPTNSPLKVSLSLLDGKNHPIQAQDYFIEDPAQQRTDRWKAGAHVPGYYLIVVPFGTPPGSYSLIAGVYPSDNPQPLRVQVANGLEPSSAYHVTLGRVQVYRPEDLQADPYKTLRDSNLIPAQTELAEGLNLDAYGIGSQLVRPGENLHVILRWHALLASLPSYKVQVQLTRGSQVIAETSGTPVNDTYPTSQWRAGEVVADNRDLRVPPEVTGGTAELEIGVEGGKTLYAADVTIASIAHTFQVPSMSHAASASFEGVGDLVGYDLDRTQVLTSDRVGLTLYWRAGAASPPEQGYKVFAQMLASDGRLIAQSDSWPAGGQRPASGWIDGEFIVDRHELVFTNPAYRGDATLIVGLYDPETLQRVPVQGAQREFYELPTRLSVAGR